MNRTRIARSAVSVVFFGLSALSYPAPARAQQYAHAVTAAVARGDSLPTVAASAGTATDSASSASKPLMSPSGEKGTGISGKVFARFVLPEDWISLNSLPGSTTPVSAASISGSTSGVETVFTMRSFGQKVRAWLNGYRLGYWPQEKGRLRSDAYKNPEGFIEVTPENEDTRVSEHFRLRDFVSHDQKDVWPKYVVLREPLLDKLELVIEDLNDHGVNAEGMRIRSGFRTPAHNYAVRGEGSARDSRHQFGDAADVFIDQDGDGKMSDLNGDGKVNFADVKMILDAVERVEARYPELVGGTGLYAYSGRSGPFAHIDVRGTKARWVRGVDRGRSRRTRSASHKTATKSSTKQSTTKPVSHVTSQKSAPAKAVVASGRSRALATAD